MHTRTPARRPLWLRWAASLAVALAGPEVAPSLEWSRTLQQAMQKSVEKPLASGAGLVKTYTAAARDEQQEGKPQKAPRPQARLRQLKNAHEAGLIDDDTFRVTQRALAAQLAGVSFTTTCVVRHPDGSGVTTTATSTAARVVQIPSASRGGRKRNKDEGTVLAPHKLDEVIARLSSRCADVAVHDADVVEYCISRLLETNDGGEECLDQSLASGCTFSLYNVIYMWSLYAEFVCKYLWAHHIYE